MTETNQEWIEKKVNENPGFTVEMVTSWLNEAIEELKRVGLDKALGGEDGPQFLEMARTSASGKLQENMSEEATEFQMMILGPYPEGRKWGKSFVEMVGFSSLNGNKPEISSISAWEDFTKIKNDVEPLASYRTGVSFMENDRIINPGTFKLTVQNATIFSKDTKIEFMGATFDDKLARLRAGIPEVALSQIEQKLSKLKISQKSGKPYTDSLDIKRMRVIVVGTNDGVAKSGKEWAYYKVIDNSFKKTLKVKFIMVWVDPSIFNKLQAGKGSLLEIYGMIQKKKTDDVASISACFVHPLLVKPLEHENNQPKTDYPQAEPEAQIHVMASAGM